MPFPGEGVKARTSPSLSSITPVQSSWKCFSCKTLGNLCPWDTAGGVRDGAPQPGTKKHPPPSLLCGIRRDSEAAARTGQAVEEFLPLTQLSSTAQLLPPPACSTAHASMSGVTGAPNGCLLQSPSCHIFRRSLPLGPLWGGACPYFCFLIVFNCTHLDYKGLHKEDKGGNEWAVMSAIETEGIVEP